MTKYYDSLPTAPVVVGHRGAGRSFAPLSSRRNEFVENTRASFTEAHRAGADWVELDVICSDDGDLFLWHDHFLAGKPVHKASSGELLALGAELFVELDDALPSGLGVNIEVKPLPLVNLKRHGEDSILEQALLLAENRPVLWSSFDPMVAIRGRDAELNSAWITRPGYPAHEAAMGAINMNIDAVVVHGFTTLEKARPHDLELGMELAREASLSIWCWDVTPEAVEELAQAGVTGFCTDEIAKVASYLR